MRRHALRRFAMLAVPVLAYALFTTTTAVSSQAAPTLQQWQGTTKQGAQIFFATTTTPAGRLILPEEFTFGIECPISHDEIVASVGYTGFTAPLSNGEFTFTVAGTSDHFTFSGVLTKTSATGDIEYALPGFVPPSEATEDCSTHHMPWTAQPSTGSAPRAPKAALHITFSKDANGHVSERIERASD